jgi:ABC-type transport system involved in cytochrome c biogenesis permease subunit
VQADARLTSAFVLEALYVCYLLLRNLIEDLERRAVVSAVFNVFAAFDIPLVYSSSGRSAPLISVFA